MSAAVDESNPKAYTRGKGYMSRAVIAGLVFALPLGASVLVSPLFRKSIKQITQPSQIITHASALGFTGASIAYLQVDPSGRTSLLPYLDLKRNLFCGAAGLAVCHMWYPGSFVLVNERGPLTFRLRQYWRVTWRCALGYFFVPHLMGMVAYACLVATAIDVSRRVGRRFGRLLGPTQAKAVAT